MSLDDCFLGKLTALFDNERNKTHLPVGFGSNPMKKIAKVLFQNMAEEGNIYISTKSVLDQICPHL